MSALIPDPKPGGHCWEPACVECYAGYRGQESPRAIVLAGVRLPVAVVMSRKRVWDAATRRSVELFECLLEAGWTVSLERSEDGSWRVRKNVFVPRVDLN